MLKTIDFLVYDEGNTSFCYIRHISKLIYFLRPEKNGALDL